jgi:hypothetical protein
MKRRLILLGTLETVTQCTSIIRSRNQEGLGNMEEMIEEIKSNSITTLMKKQLQTASLI